VVVITHSYQFNRLKRVSVISLWGSGIVGMGKWAVTLGDGSRAIGGGLWAVSSLILPLYFRNRALELSKIEGSAVSGCASHIRIIYFVLFLR
jgi:hypothetical protein